MGEEVISNISERTFSAVDAELQNVLSFILDLLTKNNANDKSMFEIELAVEEIFVNIAHYSYEGQNVGQVLIDVSFNESEVKIVFKDKGIPFDPFSKVDPDVSLNASDRKIGGLGIFLVKKKMDKMEYEFKDGMNILTITKTIKDTVNISTKG